MLLPQIAGSNANQQTNSSKNNNNNNNSQNSGDEYTLSFSEKNINLTLGEEAHFVAYVKDSKGNEQNITIIEFKEDYSNCTSSTKIEPPDIYVTLSQSGYFKFNINVYFNSGKNKIDGSFSVRAEFNENNYQIVADCGFDLVTRACESKVINIQILNTVTNSPLRVIQSFYYNWRIDGVPCNIEQYYDDNHPDDYTFIFYVTLYEIGSANIFFEFSSNNGKFQRGYVITVTASEYGYTLDYGWPTLVPNQSGWIDFTCRKGQNGESVNMTNVEIASTNESIIPSGEVAGNQSTLRYTFTPKRVGEARVIATANTADGRELKRLIYINVVDPLSVSLEWVSDNTERPARIGVAYSMTFALRYMVSGEPANVRSTTIYNREYGDFFDLTVGHNSTNQIYIDFTINAMPPNGYISFEIKVVSVDGVEAYFYQYFDVRN